MREIYRKRYVRINDYCKDCVVDAMCITPCEAYLNLVLDHIRNYEPANTNHSHVCWVAEKLRKKEINMLKVMGRCWIYKEKE
jgi:hypothetical protein